MKILNIDTHQSQATRHDQSPHSRNHSRSMSSDIIKRRPKNLSRSRSGSDSKKKKNSNLQDLSKSIQDFRNEEKNIDSFLNYNDNAGDYYKKK
jgi:hypothetical protein